LFLAVSASGYFLYKYLGGRVEDDNALRVGIITDVQSYARRDKQTGEWELSWRIKDPLERFVKKMNKEFRPDVVIDLGDFIDGKDHRAYKTWQQTEKIINKLTMPVYHVLGNHETGRFEKTVWLDLVGYNNTYYYKDITKGKISYRLVMLDSNFFPDGTDTTPEKRYYPGCINDEQWNWLESVLKEAQIEEKHVLIFIHHPPLNLDSWPNWGIFPQGEKMQALFEEYNVRAVFAGHIEQMCYEEHEQVEYFVLQGFWKDKEHLKKEYRFENAGNFYYVTVTPDDMEVNSEYRVFKNNECDKENMIGWKRELISGSKKYDCQDGHQLVQ
jgi:Icc-related predicted phosphoesterase